MKANSAVSDLLLNWIIEKINAHLSIKLVLMPGQMFQNVPTSISLAIWATAFMQGRETLERSVDCISESPRNVSTLLSNDSLALFVAGLRNS